MSYSVWMLPVNHRYLSKKYNTNIPIYVPLADKVPETLLPRYAETLESSTMIKNISRGYTFMQSGEDEYKLCQNCSIFDDRPAPLVIYELQQRLELEDIHLMFPELEEPIEEDTPGLLCFARRTLEYPFGYDLIFPH